ncbi:ABC transporter permease [Nitratireductor pacificus]|uniref:Dipeptide ABC transporter dipeptide-binding protein n=1 Tax=Nitratireductor pacificus pht-3B TaxID=391937 RepID=K2M9P0_9HYPH|nr:ABC transporter permease [Nitratireductor pacificus]EKF18856.1 dipeptide ABC transporter dipeptide-binding protein [Nitratireductor pacificus pht-3B]
MAAPSTSQTARPGSDFFLRFRRSRNAMIGSVIVAFVVLMALFGPLLTPHDPVKVNVLASWRAPDSTHWMGTDALGRDVFSRIVLGGRVSLIVSMSVLAVTLTIGTVLGMCAAYFGGWVDALVMRTVDIIFAFPELIFAILVAAVLGPGTLTVIIALSMVWWPGIARLTRSLVLGLRHEMFIEAAIVSGTPAHKIMRRHFLPNIVAPLIVRASIGVGFIIMAEATLSFLGIGIQEPEPTWGAMIRDGLSQLRTDPHLALFASLALGITMIGFNLLGDGLRDVLDPKVRN